MENSSSSLARTTPQAKSYGDLMNRQRSLSATLQDIPVNDSRRNSNGSKTLVKRHKSLSSISNMKTDNLSQLQRKQLQQHEHGRTASMPTKLDLQPPPEIFSDKSIPIEIKEISPNETMNGGTPSVDSEPNNHLPPHPLPTQAHLSDLDKDVAQSKQEMLINLSSSTKKVTFDNGEPQVLEYEQRTPLVTDDIPYFESVVFEDDSDGGDNDNNNEIIPNSEDFSLIQHPSSHPRPLPLIPFSATMPSLRTDVPASPTHTQLLTELMLQRQKISPADRLTLVMDNGEEKDKLERASLSTSRSTPLPQQGSSSSSSSASTTSPDAGSDDISELNKSTLFLEESVIGTLEYLSNQRRLRAESSDSSTGSSVASSNDNTHERAILEIPRDLTRKESLLDSERSLNTSHHHKNRTDALDTVQESPSSLKLRDKIAERRRSLAKAFESGDHDISLAESAIEESSLFQDIPEGIVTTDIKVEPLVIEKVPVKVEPQQPKTDDNLHQAKEKSVESQNDEMQTPPPLDNTITAEVKPDVQTVAPSTPPTSNSISSFLPDLPDLDNGALGMTEYLSPKTKVNKETDTEPHIAYSSNARPPSTSPFKGMLLDDEEKDASFADLRSKGQAKVLHKDNVDPTKREKVTITKKDNDGGLSTPIESPVKLVQQGDTQNVFLSPESSSQVTPEVPSPERTLSAPNGLKTRLSLSRRKPSELAETRKRISGANAGAGKLIKTHEVDIQKLAIPVQAEEFSPLSDAAYRTKSSTGQEMSKIKKLLSESRLLDVDIVESDDEPFSDSISKELDKVIERRNTRYTVKEKKEVVLATEIHCRSFTAAKSLPQDDSTHSLFDAKAAQKILAIAASRNKNLPSQPPPIPARSAQRQSRGNLQSILDDGHQSSSSVLGTSPAADREEFITSEKLPGVLSQNCDAPPLCEKVPQKKLAKPYLEESRSPGSKAIKQGDYPVNGLKQVPLDSGRLFIRLIRLYDVNLPLAPGSNAKFNLTLDNGLHCVTTSYVKMESSSPIDQEFELVTSDDLEFIITMKVKVDIPSPSRSPQSSPTMQDKRKSINSLRSLFGSPKRKKAKKEMDGLSNEQASSGQSSLVPLEHTIARDGSFARSYISFSQYANMIYGQPQTFEIACYNEWATDTTKLNSSSRPRRKPYWIGKLQVEMMYIPRASESESLPRSLKACLEHLEWAAWHRQIFHEGFLSQLGGDCPYWRRRYFKLIGATLVAHSSNESRKPRTSINLSRAEKVQPLAGSDETSNNNGLRITFGNGETLDFLASNEKQRDEWIDQLNKVIGHVPPRRRWAELVLNERAKK